MPSLLSRRIGDRSLSQHPSTPGFPQLFDERQSDPRGRLGFPVATAPSFRFGTRAPLSLPLKVVAPVIPVPAEPVPFLIRLFPNPIFQKTAETFATFPLGSTT